MNYQIYDSFPIPAGEKTEGRITAFSFAGTRRKNAEKPAPFFIRPDGKKGSKNKAFLFEKGGGNGSIVYRISRYNNAKKVRIINV